MTNFTFSHFNKLFCDIKFIYQRRRNIRCVAFFATDDASQLVSVRDTVKTLVYLR